CASSFFTLTFVPVLTPPGTENLKSLMVIVGVEPAPDDVEAEVELHAGSASTSSVAARRSGRGRRNRFTRGPSRPAPRLDGANEQFRPISLDAWARLAA